MKTILNNVTEAGRLRNDRWAGPPGRRGLRLEVCQANSGVVQTE